MSLLGRIFQKNKNKVKKATITLVGPSMAGKTTLVKYLETGEEVTGNYGTTLGIEVRKESVNIDGWKLTAIDTGGQELYQQSFWEMAITQADALIFMIDATISKKENPEMYNISVHQFAYALDILPEGIPLLVLLNKQDLIDKNPMSATEAIKILNFNHVLFSTAYLPISAKFGDGVIPAIEWLIDQLEKIV